jgi:hypothetical protein
VRTVFNVQVREATKVLETGNLLDSQGQTTGERAILEMVCGAARVSGITAGAGLILFHPD